MFVNCLKTNQINNNDSYYLNEADIIIHINKDLFLINLCNSVNLQALFAQKSLSTPKA